MMNYFEPQTITVEIDAENWVRLRKLTYGEVQDIASKHTRFDPATRTAVVDNPTAVGNAIIIASVEDWGGPGFGGRPATPENVALLPPKIVGKFADAASQLNSDLDDDEKNG